MATGSASHYFIRMDTMISAAEANRSFSRLLREVREQGRSFVVTSHGQPVARLQPCDGGGDTREAARAALFARLASQPAEDLGPWTRAELYER